MTILEQRFLELVPKLLQNLAEGQLVIAKELAEIRKLLEESNDKKTIDYATEIQRNDDR